MKPGSKAARQAGQIAVLFLLAGCSPTFQAADAAGYATMGCNELNEKLSGVSVQISRTAINRGRVAQTNIPRWVPGGARVRSRVTDRQTARIDELQQRERAISSARDRNCARRQ